MTFKNLPLALLFCSALSGCAQFKEFTNWRSLSDSQRLQVTQARQGCPIVDVVSGELRFVAAPVVNNNEQGDVLFDTAQDALPDRQMLLNIWGQRLCLLSKISPTITGMPNWRGEVDTAINNWPTFNSTTYEQQILAYTAKRDAHIAKLYTLYKQNKEGEKTPHTVLMALFPFRDFLNIRTANFQFRAGESMQVKGQKIGGSAAKICLSSSEYSTAIRPALDQARTSVVGIGSRTMSEAEALHLMVSAAYEAGATRMLQAKEASSGQTEPVVCAIEKPVPAKAKDDTRTEGEKSAAVNGDDEKKEGEKKAEGTTTDEKKPENKPDASAQGK